MPKKSNATAITKEIKNLLETCDNRKEFLAFFASKTQSERDKYVDAFIELARKQFDRFRNDGSGWAHYRDLFVKGHTPRILDTWAICWFLKAMDYLPNLQDTKTEKMGIAGYLAANPDLIEHEFWSIFEVPHERFFSFTTADDGMYGEKAWRKAILRMEHRRAIDRDRLLDGIIKVFGYHYTDFETRWFCKLLQELNPTDDEIVAREISLYPHLESNNPCVVGTVFDLLEKLRKSNKINESLFLDHCLSLLRDKSKTRIKKTLSILEGIAKRQAVPMERVQTCLIEAMSHESADIQSAALKLLLKYADFSSDWSPP